MQVKSSVLYMALFVLMSLTCALFSSSTPDNIGVPEVIIGLVLIILVGVRGILNLFFFHKEKIEGIYHVPFYVQFSALYLVIAPTATGLLVSFNTAGDYIRDIIPLLYMYIPVLVLHRVQQDPRLWLKVVVGSITVIGITFSIRHFVEGGGELSQVGKQFIWGGNLDNIAQDPATLFVLSLFSVFAIWFLFRGDIFKGVACIIIAGFPWAATIASVLRAPAVFTIIVMFWALLFSVKNLKKNFPMLIITVMAVIGLFIIYEESIFDLIEGSFTLLIDKQEAVGLSARDLEITAVMNNVDSIYILLFGEGWGGLVDSPFSSRSGWRFVHNMFLYFFFKAGLIGLLALLFYLKWFAGFIWDNIRKNDGVYFLTAVSLIVPLVISMMLEPMFKALTFGVVLLLIPLMAFNMSLDKRQ